MAVRPPDDRRSLAEALAEQGPGSRQPRGQDVRLARVCLEAGGLRIPRDAASSRFQTVPQLSLFPVQTGSRQPERICPKFACDQDWMGPSRLASAAVPRFESYLRSQTRNAVRNAMMRGSATGVSASP